MKNLLTHIFFFICFQSYAQVSTLTRSNDPVILSGADLSNFGALNPSAIVGFKFINGAWTQIPIQVDERALLDIVTPYGPLAATSAFPPSPTNPKIYFYTDATTYTGADPITTFDADDELVFMAKDAGGLFAGANYPSGIVSGSCRQITITDPLGGLGYIYLFQNGGSLSQNAGLNYVNYNFNSLGTGFPANISGTNNENTTASTSKYSWHFSSEWVSDELKIAIGNNTDILDRYKNFFSNGSCLRHEDAFSAAENAYVTNKTGSVRIIRSYMGAVSGPLTQRTHIFYEGRQDIFTDLRVHNIVGIADVFDYNSAANSMIYRNNLNTAGVTINGVQDAVVLGDISWEQVSGTPGSISILHRRTTTLTTADANFNSYYDDNSISPASNCTGDGQAWGTTGVIVNFLNGSVCTDPLASGCGVSSPWYRTFQGRRIIYIDAPNAAATLAAGYSNQFNNPLQLTIGSCPGTTTTNYAVSLSANPAAGGIVTGAGSYGSGTSVTVTATANSGYSFVNWTEGATVVSSSNNYSFNINGNRTLAANFSLITAIPGVNTIDAITVYPNPAKKELFFKNLKSGKVYTVFVYNAVGQIILQTNVSKTNPSILIRAKGLISVVINDGVKRQVITAFVTE
jgi:hypothetical protein